MTYERNVVTIDVSGRVVTIPSAAAVSLRDAAAADAARSSARRDLSLVLTRALETGSTVALQRGEARELADLVADQPPRRELAELLHALDGQQG